MAEFLTKETAFELAQKRANEKKVPYEVWCHDGDWGHPAGDIEGRRGWKVVTLGTDLQRGWVFHGLCRPEAA